MPSVEFLLFNFHSICHPWLCDTKGLKVCCQNDSSLGSIKRSSCPILDLGPLMLAFSNCFTHLFKTGFLFTLAKIKPTMCAFLWANVYILITNIYVSAPLLPLFYVPCLVSFFPPTFHFPPENIYKTM